MSELVTTDPGKRARTPGWVWLTLALMAAVVLAANAHLIYVATRSQPACVAHVRQGDAAAERGQYAAAQSSCSPRPAGRTGSP
jgi:anti-sigma-K factor RskA